jgi:hypothetical protein
MHKKKSTDSIEEKKREHKIKSSQDRKTQSTHHPLYLALLQRHTKVRNSVCPQSAANSKTGIPSSPVDMDLF